MHTLICLHLNVYPNFRISVAPFGGRRADATLMDWRGGAPSWIHRSFCDISDVPQIFHWISETICAFKVKLRLKYKFRFGVGMKKVNIIYENADALCKFTISQIGFI